MTTTATAGTTSEQAWPTMITRAYAIDDAGVRPGKITCETCGRDATGRMVDSYAAVFGEEALIDDDMGPFLEHIDSKAFNRTIDLITRSAKGLRSVLVTYHHGKTLYDTPSDAGSVPLGHDSAIRADSRGLLTSTHYGNDEFATRILQGVIDGNIAGNSFTGRIIRSDPARRARGRHGSPPPKVRRLELGLSEHGPTPLPYYTGADVVAVRAQTLDAGDDAGILLPPQETVLSQADIARRIRVARQLGRLR
jgi:phage head maturation protease